MLDVINRIIIVGIDESFYNKIVQKLTRTKNRINIHLTKVDTFLEAKQFIKLVDL